MTFDRKPLGSMGTSIRRVADFVRPREDASPDENQATLPAGERDSRLGDKLHCTLEDVSVDSVKAVREVRERE